MKFQCNYFEQELFVMVISRLPRPSGSSSGIRKKEFAFSWPLGFSRERLILGIIFKGFSPLFDLHFFENRL
jgi:hypothetical protein